MAKRIFVVFTNPVEGRDDEYNEWYTNVHLPDVLKIPGVTAATRYSLSETQMVDQACEFKYCAIYELDTDDVASVRDQIISRSNTELMPISPAMSPVRSRFFFDPIAELGS